MVRDWHSVEWEEIIDRAGIVPRGTQKKEKDKREIINLFTAFDIETSTIWLNEDRTLFDVHSFMYSWAFQVENITICGRYWEDFFSFLDYLYESIKKFQLKYNLELEPKIIIWVHNLAYEWSFLSGLYDFQPEDCFFRDIRKPIYCRIKQVFEFRCSYIQTNLSLAMLCKQMGVPEKLSGQKFNYEKIRFPWTELTDYEKEYIITDVESLVLAMKKRVTKNGDTLASVPLTSTGYVRRDCKESLKDRYFDIRDMKPDERQYRLLRKAFRGGNTHGNRAYVGKIVENVNSYDIVSCYPTQQLTQKFPMKPFRWLDGACTLERVFNFIGLGYAVVGLYEFKGLRLKNKKTPMPYISLSRTETQMYIIKEEKKVLKNGSIKIKEKRIPCVKLDNGRILESRYSEMALTEIDLEIILNQYTFDEFNVKEAMVAKKDFLPEEYRKVIQEYYNNKTVLKGAETDEEKYLLMKSKNSLNAIYGMSSTDPIHQEVKYYNGVYTRSGYDTMTNEEREKCLMKAPFPYQWGVYTTALARRQLQKAIDLCGSKIVYCDTDSVKVKGDIDIEKLNNPLLTKAERAGAYADDRKGRRHYIGVFEDDGHYDRFITQGSKRYAYETDGHLGVTVSGVTKKRNEETGEYYAVEELKTLERFKPGMIWEKAGGTMAVYKDNDDFDYTDPESGRTIHITKNVNIIPTTYNMTYEKDFALLLNEIKLYGEYKWERE